MITRGRSGITLDRTFPNTHAMAVDNQDNVFGAHPASLNVHLALRAEVDELAFQVVIALNEAHEVLVNAGAVTTPPPSDRWYRLIEQLTEQRRPAGGGLTFPPASEDAVDLKRQKRLYVGAAAFLAAEAHHLEDHCATLSDDAGQTVVRDLSQIADQARDAADVLLKRAEDTLGGPPPPLPPPTGAWIWEQFTRPWFITVTLVALAVVYVLAGNFIADFSLRDHVIALPFIIVAGIIVLKWHLQVHRFIDVWRTPQTVAEWLDEIMRQSVLLDRRADALRDLIRRVHLVAGNVAAERRVCEIHGLSIATSELDSLGRQLQDVSNSVEHLAELVTESSEEARRFTESCQRDPREACSEYGRLPLVLNPERIEAAIDNLVLVLHLTVEVAVDIPLQIQSKEPHISPVPAGKIATAVVEILQGVQGSSRSLKRQCRSMLRAFDLLHRLAAVESIAALELGLASRMTVRAAVAASVSTQPRARRPAARTAFVREVSLSRNQSWIWIGKATAAAIKRGQKSRV